MKVSKYNVKINDLGEEGYGIVYNTLSRKYVIYDKYKEKLLIDTFDNINKNECSPEEIKIMEKALKAGLIIEDNADEADIIKFNECNKVCNDEHIKLILLPTMDYKFKCRYCCENNKKTKVEHESEKNILKIIDNRSETIKSLNVLWFLRDSSIDFNRIVSMSDRIKRICRKNNVEYKEDIISSGYAFSHEVIEKIKVMGVSRLQVTIETAENVYDKRRDMVNEEGSFHKIYENILRVLKNKVSIILRCNIDKKNYGKVLKLFETIPEGYRGFVDVSLGNLQYENRKMSFYYLYKGLIDRGYRYDNNYIACEECFENGFAIDCNEELILFTDENNREYMSSNLEKKDNMTISNSEGFNRSETICVLDNEECLNCIQFPLCVDSHKLGKINETSKCKGNTVDGLKLKERIFLECYYDKKRNLIEDKVI